MSEKPTYEELEQRIQKLEQKESERKRIEDAPDKKINQLHTILSHAPLVLSAVNLEGEFILSEGKGLELLGRNPGEFVGISIFDFYKNNPDILKYIRKAMSGESVNAEVKLGSVVFDVNYDPIRDDTGKISGVVVVSSIITERKQAEEALRESEERYRTILESIDEGYYEVDLKGNFTFVNNSMCKIRGSSMDELIGMNYREYMDQKNAKRVYRNFNEVYRTGKPIKGIEWESVRKDGIKRHVESSASLMKGPSGNPVGFRGITADITDRKLAEKEIDEKTHLNQTLLDAMPCVAMLIRPSTRLIVASNEAARKFGAFPGKTCFETWGQRNEPCSFCLAPKVWETRKAQHMEIGALDIIWDAHWFSIQEDLYLYYVFDITEKRKLEAQFQRSQKIESLGLMAGGIAHDLNNILSGIVSYPELLLMDLSEDSPLRKPIETIKESGMRAADVVSDLLTIARGVATGKEVLNLNTMIEECLSSAEHQELKTGHSLITFKTEFDSDLLNISCSPTHIKKSLTNLLTNASEAIEASGTVTLSTENRYLDEPLKGYEDVRKGEYAVLTVSDDGSGISADDLERIFEPFYTKKVMGRSGTGLGLAVVWNTVQDHDGYININTGKKGTAFELYFPVTRDEVAIEGDAVPVEDYLGHGERVLVVDDEKRQREIACGILTKLGYNAEAVSSGEEAVEYLKEQSVDLIVLDMIMPQGINGRETYERVIKIHPGQKAIIASGYAETPDVKKAQRLGAGKYIKKPYTMGKIGLAVKEELEK